MSTRSTRTPKSAAGGGGAGGGRQRLMTQSQQQDQRVSRELQQRRARRQARRLNAMPFRMEIRGLLPSFIFYAAVDDPSHFGSRQITILNKAIVYPVHYCCCYYGGPGRSWGLQNISPIVEMRMSPHSMTERVDDPQQIIFRDGLSNATDKFSTIQNLQSLSLQERRLVNSVSNYVFRDLPTRGNGQIIRSDFLGMTSDQKKGALRSEFLVNDSSVPSIWVNVHIELAFETLDAMIEFIYNHHLQYLTTLDGTQLGSLIRMTMIERDNARNPIQGREPRVLFDNPFFSLDMVPLIIQRTNR